LLNRLDQRVSDACSHLDSHGRLPAAGSPHCWPSGLAAGVSRIPEDLIIRHYTGSTSGSADWPGTGAATSSATHGAFALTDEIPFEPDRFGRPGQFDGESRLPAGGSPSSMGLTSLLTMLASGNSAWLPVSPGQVFRLLICRDMGVPRRIYERAGGQRLNVPLFDREEHQTPQFSR